MSMNMQLTIGFLMLSTLPIACYSGPEIELLVDESQQQLLESTTKDIKPSVKTLFVFGDSLSDTGALNKNTFGWYAPARTYYKNRCSNGPIWIDYVESALSAEVYNYAVAGAETGEKAGYQGFFVPGTKKQIQLAREQINKTDLDSAAAILWIGPNNYFGKVRDNVTITVFDIKSQIRDLLELGFNHITIGTMPNLDKLPVDVQNPRIKTDAELLQFTRSHNRSLSRMLVSIRKSFPGVVFTTFDAHNINALTNRSPAKYGFLDLKVPCFKGNFLGQFQDKQEFCPGIYSHKYWDFTHPNSKMHCYYAAQFLKDFSSSLSTAYQLEEGVSRCRSILDKTINISKADEPS